MTIDTIVLRLLKLPLRDCFQNRWERIEQWTKLIVEVGAEGAVGYGECMAMENPYYSYETVATAWSAIDLWLSPLVFEWSFKHPMEVCDRFAHVSGHYEAKAALECAIWDLYARLLDVPIYATIGGCRRAVQAGATIGIQGSIDTVLQLAEIAVAAGYERLKLKIKPGHDREILRAIRAAFPAVTLLADANGAYSHTDINWLASLDILAPIILEQPFPATDWRSSVRLQSRTSAHVCLDESITCLDDADQMIWLRAATLVNLKIGRVGGIAAAVRIHDRCRDAGIPVFIGSKTETGIGRWLNIHVATLDNVRYPSDVSASMRYFVEDIVREPVALVGRGLVEPLTGPGFGTVPHPELLDKYTVTTAERRRTLRCTSC